MESSPFERASTHILISILDDGFGEDLIPAASLQEAGRCAKHSPWGECGLALHCLLSVACCLLSILCCLLHVACCPSSCVALKIDIHHFGKLCKVVLAVGKRPSPSAAPQEDWPCGVAGSGFATEQRFCSRNPRSLLHMQRICKLLPSPLPREWQRWRPSQCASAIRRRLPLHTTTHPPPPQGGCVVTAPMNGAPSRRLPPRGGVCGGPCPSPARAWCLTTHKG